MIRSHIPGDSLRRLVTPVLLSLVVVLPFVVLELVNRRGYHEGFPFVLFALMWLLALCFMLIAASVSRSLRAGEGGLVNRLGLLIGVILMIVIAWVWAGIIIDQMPCFLGVPLCD